MDERTKQREKDLDDAIDKALHKNHVKRRLRRALEQGTFKRSNVVQSITDALYEGGMLEYTEIVSRMNAAFDKTPDEALKAMLDQNSSNEDYLGALMAIYDQAYHR